jgi:hypothetical protein
MIVIERGDLVMVFNFHPTQSYTDYKVGCLNNGKPTCGTTLLFLPSYMRVVLPLPPPPPTVVWACSRVPNA